MKLGCVNPLVLAREKEGVLPPPGRVFESLGDELEASVGENRDRKVGKATVHTNFVCDSSGDWITED